jgi:hypothetical protein
MPTPPYPYRTLAQTPTTLRRAYVEGDTLVVQDLGVVTEMRYPLEEVGVLDTMANAARLTPVEMSDPVLRRLALAKLEREGIVPQMEERC